MFSLPSLMVPRRAHHVWYQLCPHIYYASVSLQAFSANAPTQTPSPTLPCGYCCASVSVRAFSTQARVCAGARLCERAPARFAKAASRTRGATAGAELRSYRCCLGWCRRRCHLSRLRRLSGRARRIPRLSCRVRIGRLGWSALWREACLRRAGESRLRSRALI